MTKLSPEQQLEQYRAQHGELQGGALKNDSSAPKKPTEGLDSLNSAQAEIKRLQYQLQEKEDAYKKAKHERDSYKQVIDDQQNNLDSVAVSDVINSNTDRFEKHYSFPVSGDKKNLEFDIVMRPMTIVEQAKVSVKATQLATNTIDLLPSNVAFALQGLAALSIVGEKYPEEFKHLDKIYRYDIISSIWDDYLGWLATFQGKQEF